MNQFAVLTHRVKTKKGRLIPVFDTVTAEGYKIVSGCLVFFVHSDEFPVKTYGVGGWLAVEEDEED